MTRSIHTPPLHGRRQSSSLVLVLALVIGNLAAHKAISDLCDRLFVLLGRTAYEAATLLAIGAASVAGALTLHQQRKRRAGRPPMLALLALGVMTLAAQRWLLVSNVELIHFPQFALLAALLLASGMRPGSAWLVASLAGILDEVYQWLVIYDGVPHTYLDFNDMLLNAIGAAWAVLLWPPVPVLQNGADGSGESPFGWLWAVAVLAVLFLLYLDPPAFVPLLGRAMTGRAYRVLTAGEALAGLIVIWLTIAAAISPRGQRPFDRAPPAGATDV